jgi:hypothetical protein
MFAAAVEDYEATFAGIETILGLADSTLVLIRERAGGRYLSWIVWRSKKNDKLFRSGILGKQDIRDAVALLTLNPRRRSRYLLFF